MRRTPPGGCDDNCKREFEYACLRKGVVKLLAVVMEDEARQPAEWSGPVGFNLGTTLYIDASSDQLDGAANQLVQKLAQESSK